MSSVPSFMNKPLALISTSLNNNKQGQNSNPNENKSIYKDFNSELKITQSCRKKYPHMVPVYVMVQSTADPNSSQIFSSIYSSNGSSNTNLKLSKNKFLISQNTTGLQLQRHILKFTERQINQGLYFFIVDKSRHRMLQNNILIKQPYEMYKGDDGYLKILVMKQNVF